MLEVEAALAEAEAQLDMIPREAAEENKFQSKHYIRYFKESF